MSPYSLGIYELHVQYILINLLRPGMVFYDIGANNGFMSLLGAITVGMEGCVYAFEPLPQNALRISKIVSANKFDNVKIVQFAVGNVSGEADFFIGNSNSEASFAPNNRGDKMRVEVRTLDEITRQFGEPDLVKIDVEGFEVEVLIGASELLAKRKAPKLIIELHSEESARKTYDVLRFYNYAWSEIHPVIPRPNIYPIHIKCWKK